MISQNVFQYTPMGGWARVNIPADDSCHIKAMYDYISFIASNGKNSVRAQAMRYPCSSKKWTEIIQIFLGKVFKPLIDFINDQIFKEMIVVEEERKSTIGNTYVQNIKNLNGNAYQQTNGIINSYNYNGFESTNTLALIDKLIASLTSLNGVDDEEVECVKDDLESVQEQLQSGQPKKSRLKKALLGIKKFSVDVLNKVAVGVVAGTIASTDWQMLIQQLEDLIQKLL